MFELNASRSTIIKRQDQSLRLLRHMGALATAFFHLCVCILLYKNGYFWAHQETLLICISVAWAGGLTFTFLIVSGINKRFNDPSLTMPQMLWTTAVLITTVYLLNDLRFVMIMFFFAMLTFGFFSLRKYQFVLLALIMNIGYAGVISYLYAYFPEYVDIDAEIATISALAMTSITVVLVGSAITNLRHKLHERNIEINQALKINEQLASMDDLTGLYNRRRFMEMITTQKAFVDREKSDFVICFADLDHFKIVNDNFGHQAGDVVLKTFADIIKNSIREVDVAARYGGEEFVIMLVNTSLENANMVSERIRDSMERHNFSDYIPGLSVTVSMGITNYRKFMSIQQTLSHADAMMYKAKQAGRNRVVAG